MAENIVATAALLCLLRYVCFKRQAHWHYAGTRLCSSALHPTLSERLPPPKL